MPKRTIAKLYSSVRRGFNNDYGRELLLTDEEIEQAVESGTGSGAPILVCLDAADGAKRELARIGATIKR